MRKKNSKNKSKKKSQIHKNRFKKTNQVSPRKNRRALLATAKEVNTFQAKLPPPGSAPSESHNSKQMTVSILQLCAFILVIYIVWGRGNGNGNIGGRFMDLGMPRQILCSPLNCAVANLPNTNKKFCVWKKFVSSRTKIFQQIESSRIFKWPNIIANIPPKKTNNS